MRSTAQPSRHVVHPLPLVRPLAALVGGLIMLVALVRLALTIGGALDVFADYHAYYRAATNLRAGQDLYAEGRLLVAYNDYNFWTQTDGQYVYPPALAIAFLPLTLVDIGQGGVVWLLVLTLACLAGGWQAARLCGYVLPWSAFCGLALPVAGILPLLLGAHYGVITPRSLLLVLLACLVQLPLAFAARQSWPVRYRALAYGVPGVASLLLAAFVLARGLYFGTLDPFLVALSLPGGFGSLALLWCWASRMIALLDAVWPESWPGLMSHTIVILSLSPVLLSLTYGQVDLALLLLTTASLFAYRSRRPWLAGFALGLAAAFKPTLALYSLFYLRKRGWSTLGAAALTGLVVGFGPFLFLGWRALSDWFAITRYFGSGDYLAYPNNQSLRGLLLRLFVGGPDGPPLLPSPVLATVLWLGGAIVGGVLWWHALATKTDDAARSAAEWGLTTILLLACAPLSEDIHFVAAIPPLALLVATLVRGTAQPRAATLTIFACLCFMIPPDDLVRWLGVGGDARLLASLLYPGGLLLAGLALRPLLMVQERAVMRRTTPLSGRRDGGAVGMGWRAR
jgi:hypothetical protein